MLSVEHIGTVDNSYNKPIITEISDSALIGWPKVKDYKELW